ncbi:TIGR01777 family oxidoreductase [Amycolatopsis albispora]|uniref:Epimerase n=1 Tax=Amycolatopsis albispora TaxID=1804986 RepID=A0A344L7Y4_9PSEU|nr:TIGR01777 family oxidoreductase [Amycolatopsis albispora]AXB44158.1 epimerase [Amycolatopsis albispora]
MRVLIAGSSGLIGNALTARLRADGHEVVRLVRRETRRPGEYSWDPPAGRVGDGAFDGTDAVVNLCGAPLLPARWSAARKQVILDSRIEPTEVLAEAVAEHGIPVLLNASAVGYYGDAGSAMLEESAPNGTGFLANLCAAWENATEAAGDARVVRLRTGLVLSGDGGLLGPLKPLFSLALGGKLGDGTQYMPWIAEEDHISALMFALTDENLSGPVNVCGPLPVTNAEFTREFGRVLNRPAPWWVPAPAMKLALGEAAEEMALASQRAVPRALEDAGFEFKHKTVGDALAAAVAR